MYGDIKTPGNKKAAAAAARLAWRAVWADANKAFANGVPFPGEEELNSRILDHLTGQQVTGWADALRLSNQAASTDTGNGNEEGAESTDAGLSEAEKKLRDAEALGTVLGG